MSESIILGLLIALRIDKDLTYKSITASLITLAVISLWLLQSEFIYSYMAITLSIVALANRILKNEHKLINIPNVTILSLLSLCAANWSIPIVTVSVLLGISSDKSPTLLKNIVLIVASAFALNITTDYKIVSVILCFMGVVFSGFDLNEKKYSSSILWIGVVTANILVSDYSIDLFLLLLCTLMSLFYSVAIWVSDREEINWQRLLQIFVIIILATGVQFGLMGLWAALLVGVSLTTLLSTDTDYGTVTKVPYTAMSAFVLLPVGPIMFLLVNGKAGLPLVLGLVISMAISVCVWRWIGQREKRVGDIELGYLKITHAVLLLSFMVIGCLKFMAENKVGLISYLAMSFIILILFSLMGLDQKFIKLPGRKTIDLKLNRSISNRADRNESDLVLALSVNRVAEGIVRAGFILATDILSYLKRIYPVVALILIMAVIVAGIIDG